MRKFMRVYMEIHTPPDDLFIEMKNWGRGECSGYVHINDPELKFTKDNNP